MPRRVVTVCQLLHSLNVGGAEMLAARLARRLREQFRFVFVCLEERGTLGEQLAAEGFPVEALRRRPGLDWGCIWRLRQVLRRQGVDLIHAHQYTPFSYALLARLFSGLPILFTEHGRHQPDFPRRKRIVFNRLLLRRRDRVVGVGAAVRQALIANEGIPARRVKVLYNGIDVASFARDEGKRESIRHELGLAQEDWVILQVARLDYLKDHLTAVRTLGRVVGQVPRARLVLVGEGPEEAAIRAQVEREGLGERVLFLGLRQDVPRLLHAADVFLLTSVSEGIPLTLLEAMAADLPLVSTNVGGTSEVIREGETGYLAPAKDDAALAAALVRLAGDPALSRRLGLAGKQRAREFFDEPRMARCYAEVYQEMMQGNRPTDG